MAEGRNIQIRLAATGGDAAAAEIRKVEVENKALSSSANTVSASSASMRTGLMNVGYQVQDFAVQVTSGTSASRAFAQQAPQLLSGFGLIGVAAGTAVALGAPFLEQMLGFEAAADKAGPAFDDLAERMGKTAAAKAKLETSQWVDTLSQEEDEIRKQNEALDRNRKLLESKLEAQSKLDGAKADKEIAGIDADNTLSEEEKIKRKAAVRERMERKKIEDQVNSEGRAVAADEAAAKAKEDEAKRLADIAARISAEKASTENELVSAEKRERQRAAANVHLPQAREKLAEADKKEFIWGSNPLRSEEDKKTAKDEAESARRYVEILENQAMSDPENVARTAALRAKKQALEAAESKAKQEAGKAGDEASRKTLDAAARRECFESNKETVTQTYQTEAEARRIRTNQQAEDARRRAEEKQQRDAEKQQRDAEKQQRDAEKGEAFGIRRQGAEAKLGADAVKLLPDGVRSEFRSAVQKAARGLQNGDQGGEVKELISLMNTLARAVKGKDSSTEAALAGLRREVATLQHQIKNNRR